MMAVRKDLKVFIGHRDGQFIDAVKDILQHSFTVFSSSNGIDIVNTILELQPDLAVLDHDIPEIDVLKWCEKLSDDYPHITTVIYVNLSDVLTAKQKWRQRALDYIIGPISLVEFSEEINKVMRFLIIEREREMLVRNKIEFTYAVSKSIVQMKQRVEQALISKQWADMQPLLEELSLLENAIRDFDSFK